MYTPDDVERGSTLLTAVARYEELRTRDALAPTADETAADDEMPHWGDDSDAVPLTKEEALELLALGEVIARKAGYGRQLAVRTARATGASWSQIGGALGTSKQSAWEAYARWVEDQVEQHRRSGYEGMDDDWAVEARALAGEPDEKGTS
jgi:hypothetical protein